MAVIHSKIEKYINFKVVDKAVSAEKNLELYDEILSKHSTGVFSKKKLLCMKDCWPQGKNS